MACHFKILAFLLLCVRSSYADVKNIRVMTFNTWNSGINVKDGLAKIVKHIKYVDPDIVALQEIEPWAVRIIHNDLGHEWFLCQNLKNAPIATLTKFAVTELYTALNSSNPAAVGCQVEISRWPHKRINVWNVALHSEYYGPYIACLKQTTDPYQLYLADYGGHRDPAVVNGTDKTKKAGRLTEMLNLFQYLPFWNSVMQASRDVPMLFLGDFNSPSHQDWVEALRSAHCNWTFHWPISRMIEEYDFHDSYRSVWPDPSRYRGDTWSPICKYMPKYESIFLEEPQDRIDIIYSKGDRLKATNSRTYYGSGMMMWMPEHNENDWPSDHAAVISDFEYR